MQFVCFIINGEVDGNRIKYHLRKNEMHDPLIQMLLTGTNNMQQSHLSFMCYSFI